MLELRSVEFNILFYLNLVLHIIVALPTFFLPRRAFMAIAKSWGHTSNALLAVAGIRIEIRWLEKIRPGALLVASNDQSFWEAFTLLTLFDDPAFIVKRELAAPQVPAVPRHDRAGSARPDSARARKRGFR